MDLSRTKVREDTVEAKRVCLPNGGVSEGGGIRYPYGRYGAPAGSTRRSERKSGSYRAWRTHLAMESQDVVLQRGTFRPNVERPRNRTQALSWFRIVPTAFANPFPSFVSLEQFADEAGECSGIASSFAATQTHPAGIGGDVRRVPTPHPSMRAGSTKILRPYDRDPPAWLHLSASPCARGICLFGVHREGVTADVLARTPLLFSATI